MPISKIGQRQQVVISNEICHEPGLREGDFVKGTREKSGGELGPIVPDDYPIVRRKREFFSPCQCSRSERRKMSATPRGIVNKSVSRVQEHGNAGPADASCDGPIILYSSMLQTDYFY